MLFLFATILALIRIRAWIGLIGWVCCKVPTAITDTTGNGIDGLAISTHNHFGYDFKLTIGRIDGPQIHGASRYSTRAIG